MLGWWRIFVASVALLCGANAVALAAPVSPDFRHFDPKRRIAAAEAAAAHQNADAIDALIDLLRDRVPTVRLAAVRALHVLLAAPSLRGKADSRRASRYLMVLAPTDFDDRVREAARAAVRGVDPSGYVSKLATADARAAWPDAEVIAHLVLAHGGRQ